MQKRNKLLSILLVICMLFVNFIGPLGTAVVHAEDAEESVDYYNDEESIQNEESSSIEEDMNQEDTDQSVESGEDLDESSKIDFVSNEYTDIQLFALSFANKLNTDDDLKQLLMDDFMYRVCRP